MGKKKGRRQNREGSLFQRASDGRWVASHFLGYKPNGKPDRKEFYGESPDEALSKKVQFLAAHDKGFTPPKGRGDTLGEWLIHWLYHIKRDKVKESTWYDSYRPKVEKHLIPNLGHVLLKKLTQDQIEEWMTAMKKGYAPRTILQCLQLLKQALNEAVQREKVGRNVAQFVKPPPLQDQEPIPPEREEAKVILDATAARRNGVRWAVSLAVGPRRGEALALMRPMLNLSNLDKASLRIAWGLSRVPWQHGCEDPAACAAKHHIRACPPDCPKLKRRQGGRPHRCRKTPCPPKCNREHSKHCIRKFCPADCLGHAKACPLKTGGGLVLTEPKSEKSKRSVRIPRPLAEMLALHLLALDEEQSRRGWVGWGHEPRTAENPAGCDRRPRPREVVCPRCRRPTKKDSLIFTTPEGLPVSPSDDWREWTALLEELGLPAYRPHDARHFVATVLLELGVDVRVVQEILGHSSSDFTRRSYQHVTERMNDDAAEKITGALWDAQSDSTN